MGTMKIDRLLYYVVRNIDYIIENFTTELKGNRYAYIEPQGRRVNHPHLK